MGDQRHEPEVIQRARARIPQGLNVAPQTTPVVSFGRPQQARVATLGINPSDKEFNKPNGSLLPLERKRLVDREILNIEDESELSLEDAERVVEGGYSYFENRDKVYKTWFSWMETYAVCPSGASYFDGSACHLDLVQWATSPVWRDLDPNRVQRVLLDSDVEFLRFQLTTYKIPLLLLNGRAVLNQFMELRIADLEEEKNVPMREGARGCHFFVGTFAGTKVLGWTNNIPSQTPQANRETISNWIAGHASGNG